AWTETFGPFRLFAVSRPLRDGPTFSPFPHKERHVKRPLISLVLGAAVAAALVGCGAQAAVTAPATAPVASPSTTVRPSAGSTATVAPTVGASESCGADSYRNVDGICVHRPVTSSTVPAGATAVC